MVAAATDGEARKSSMHAARERIVANGIEQWANDFLELLAVDSGRTVTVSAPRPVQADHEFTAAR